MYSYSNYFSTENIIRDSRNNLKYLNISPQNGNNNSF